LILLAAVAYGSAYTRRGTISPVRNFTSRPSAATSNLFLYIKG
jgi:hypothetical protein